VCSWRSLFLGFGGAWGRGVSLACRRLFRAIAGSTPPSCGGCLRRRPCRPGARLLRSPVPSSWTSRFFSLPFSVSLATRQGLWLGGLDPPLAAVRFSIRFPPASSAPSALRRVRWGSGLGVPGGGLSPLRAVLTDRLFLVATSAVLVRSERGRVWSVWCLGASLLCEMRSFYRAPILGCLGGAWLRPWVLGVFGRAPRLGKSPAGSGTCRAAARGWAACAGWLGGGARGLCGWSVWIPVCAPRDQPPTVACCPGRPGPGGFASLASPFVVVAHRFRV